MKTVWINGTFDIIHVGHIKLIEYASILGDIIIGIDSDLRVKQLKGNTRPFNTQENRAYVLKNIKGVNKVDVFNNDEELEYLIKSYSPDYMVIGDDYKNKKIIGQEYIKKIIFFKKVLGFSTTKILNENISNR